MNYTLQLTTECNFKCSYCYQNYESKEKLIHSIDESKLKSILDYIYLNDDDDLINVSFIGGEPLLKKHLIKLGFEYIEKSYVDKLTKTRFNITTNGSLLDLDTMELLEKYKVNLSISLDGDEYTHNLNRKSTINYYQDIIDKLKIMQQKKIPFDIRMTLTSNNVELLTDNILYFINNSFTKINIGFDWFSKWADNDFITLKEQYTKMAKIFLDYKKNNKDINIDLINKKLSTFIFDKKPMFCNAGSKNFTFNSNGEIYPCIYVVNKDRFKIGNIIDAVNESTHEKSIKNSLFYGELECYNCDIASFCYGRQCGYGNFAKEDFLNKPSSALCKHEKILFETLRELVSSLIEINDREVIDMINLAKEKSIKIRKGILFK